MRERVGGGWMLLVAGLVGSAAGLGCEEIPGGAGTGGGGGDGSGATGGGATTSVEDPFAGGAVLDVEVPASGRVFVDLDTKAIVEDGKKWDLAFEGQGVFTNGGVSGEMLGEAFGPVEAAAFLADEIPEHPFMIEDEATGAFVDWYAYDGVEHVIYSRFHVYGVRRGDAVFKVQVLGYYGVVQGAPVSALFSVRAAGVSAAGSEAITTIEDIDATAGGVMGTDADPSACVTLASGAVTMLAPPEAQASKDWDLCFRRASISVNGALGGPGGVEAVDLDREATEDEKLEEVKLLTAESELARLEKVTLADLSKPDLPWSGDRIVSAFTDKWIEPGSSPLAPAKFSWLVAGSDGLSPFLVAFESFTGATADHPGTVRLRIKALPGSL